MLAAVQESSRHELDSIILAEHGDAAQQLGYSPEEVIDAFAPSRLGQAYATLEVGGVEFSSFRHQVGVLANDDRSRGGCELSPDVSSEKIFHKSVTMEDKHSLGQTGNVGGKSGICATREELAAIGSEGRRSLFAQHAEAHGINPYTNVVATDIGTFGPDMDAIAEYLLPEYGAHAGAAASGASKKYGGEPELHAIRTGLGASIVLDRYLHSVAPGNPRVTEAIEGGRPLRILVQGLGKAGAHFVRTMPAYVQLAGALEQYGGIVSPDSYLDREEVLSIAEATKLNPDAQRNIHDILWMPPASRAEFWAQSDVHILAPCFDRNQVDADDIRTFAEGGGFAVASIANGPVTAEGHKEADRLGLDIIPDKEQNIGGTISSQLIADKILGQPDWTPAGYDRDWRTQVTMVADTVTQTRNHISAEQGRFVSLDEAANLIIVASAMRRLRQVRGLQAA